MEQEIREAKELYEANLASVKEALFATPDDVDLLAAQQQLQSALDDLKEEEFKILNDKNNSGHDHPPLKKPRRGASSVSDPNQDLNQRIKHSTSSVRSIHPRSKYSSQQPDFHALSIKYPLLKQYFIEATGVFDFSNFDACRHITRILLKEDFDITWDLPDGHLVPPVTNRLNYILWIEDLLILSCNTSLSSSPLPSLPLKNRKEKEQEGACTIRGLDIGCGSSLIYPLLGAAACGWHFVGVDVTDEAVEWATKNRDANPRLKDLIQVIKVPMQTEQATFFSSLIESESQNDHSSIKEPKPPRILSTALHHYLSLANPSSHETTDPYFSFSMCNPPFFERMEQANSNPNTAFGGTAIESIYPGGEEAFVRNMFEDSRILKSKIHWYTTMVGKKSTLKQLRQWLHGEPGVTAIRTTEFFQGKTSRWGVAWSFVVHPSVANVPLRRDTTGSDTFQINWVKKTESVREPSQGAVTLVVDLQRSKLNATDFLKHIQQCIADSNTLKTIHSTLRSHTALTVHDTEHRFTATVTLLLQQHSPDLYVVRIARKTPERNDMWFKRLVEIVEQACQEVRNL